MGRTWLRVAYGTAVEDIFVRWTHPTTAVVVVYVISQTVFLKGFETVESRQMQEQVKRAQAAIAQNLAELDADVLSYSSWDDSVAFLKTQSQAYVTNNLPASFYTGFKANLAVFVRTDGSVVYAQGFDLAKGKLTPIPAGLGTYLTAQSPLGSHPSVESKLSGILSLPQGQMLIDSQPILTSDGKGPVQGAFIMGRWLNESAVGELAARTLLSLHLEPVDALGLPASVRSLLRAGAPSQNPIISVRDASTLDGYAVLDDIFGRPVAVLRVEARRSVYLQGMKSVRYFMFALIGVVLVFGLATVGVLERSVLGRLTRLTAAVRNVRPAGRRLDPKSLEGKDELAVLARTIDSGFSELESVHETLEVRHRELQGAHRRLRQLQEVSVSLASSLNLGDSLSQIGTATLDIFEGDELWLISFDPNEDRLDGLIAFARPATAGARLPKLLGCATATARIDRDGNELLWKIVNKGYPFFASDLASPDGQHREIPLGVSLSKASGLRSMAVVPLAAEGRSVGLAVAVSDEPREFTPDHRATILLLASQIAMALKNTRLYEEIKEISEIDPLSGLYNRRSMFSRLDQELARARRSGGRLSLLIADIDNFKNFNDTYGHQVGDEIIKRVGDQLRQSSREADAVGRFGGDEFLVILPATDGVGARAAADHLRAALVMAPYSAPEGSLIPLRVSCGCATFPEDGDEEATLIACCDVKLYESKRWGGVTPTHHREQLGLDELGSKAFSTLDALVTSVDNKDRYTRRHSAQVAERATSVAAALGLGAETRETLYVAALLHDVGKIAIPDTILRKPGALTPAEKEMVKQHPIIGGAMIAQHLPHLEAVREAVVSHHERWDGSGYLHGLKGEAIPLLGRILAVADAYSAMSTDRPYRSALPPQAVLAELSAGSGVHFDPEVVSAFIAGLVRQPTA